MSEAQMVGQALETNSFATSAASASIVNPEIWVSQIEQFARANLVVAPLGKFYDYSGQGGDVFNVTVNAEISAAALTESTAITPSALTYTQVQFTPTEYGLGIAITRKERIRSFFDVMTEKAQVMGYALAKTKDSKAIAQLVAGATSTVVANGVAVSAIASSDTIDTDDIAAARGVLRAGDRDAKYFVIHPYQEKDLLKLSDFIDASVYGGREAVLNGEIGKYLGMKVLVTTLIPTNATTSTARNALMFDDGAFGILQKMGVTLNSDYKVLEREFIMAAVEDYDVQVLHSDKVVVLASYAQA